MTDRLEDLALDDLKIAEIGTQREVEITEAIRNLKVVSEEKSKLCFCVGSITEKIARQSGYHNTLSAGGTVNALKNLIINSDQINEKSKIAYFCGDNVAYDLDLELKKEGLKISKIINYTSEKI